MKGKILAMDTLRKWSTIISDCCNLCFEEVGHNNY